jgi:hypothetical protein
MDIKKRVATVVVSAVSLGVTAAFLGMSWTPAVKASQGPNSGLHQAALKTGFHATAYTFSSNAQIQSLKRLTADSDAIFVGRVQSNVCLISRDEQTIFIYYAVHVESTLKGHVKTGADLTVLVPGGRVTFADGTMAQVNTPGLMRPVNGGRYAWFVKHAAAYEVEPNAAFIQNGGAFFAAFGPLSIYELKSDNTPVRPAGRLSTAFARRLRAAMMTPEKFIEATRAALHAE